MIPQGPGSRVVVLARNERAAHSLSVQHHSAYTPTSLANFYSIGERGAGGWVLWTSGLFGYSVASLCASMEGGLLVAWHLPPMDAAHLWAAIQIPDPDPATVMKRVRPFAPHLARGTFRPAGHMYVRHVTARPWTDADEAALPSPGHPTKAQVVHPNHTDQRASDVKALVQAEALRQNVDPTLAVAVAWVESRFNPAAVSRDGAKGVMQLMPVNVVAYGLADPFEPVANIRAGVQILRRLLARYKRTDLALAAYRSGPGNITKRGIDRKDETYINAVRSAMAEHLIAVYTP